jgi:glycerol-3-phosphate dehydrogenase subunit C
MATPTREGNLEAPTRHPLDWRNPDFYDEASLFKEMERVFDICHGCRRCVSLCQSFPTLFDLVDESDDHGSGRRQEGGLLEGRGPLLSLRPVLHDQVPLRAAARMEPGFPHLMLRAKAVHFKKGDTKLRDKVLTSTDAVGRLAGIPVVAQVVNAVNKLGPGAQGPGIRRRHPRRCLAARVHQPSPAQPLKNCRPARPASPAGRTRGKVALFATCYMNRNEPGPGEDLARCSSTTASRSPSPRRSAAAACPSWNWATWTR